MVLQALDSIRFRFREKWREGEKASTMVNSLCFMKTEKISKERIAKVSFYFLICKLCFVLQHLEGSNTLLKAFASNKNE